MYYIRQQKEDPKKLDMCFDCTNYQSQFPLDVPFEKHIFQTIFLNDKDKHLWTKDEIDPDKIIRASALSLLWAMADSMYRRRGLVAS